MKRLDIRGISRPFTFLIISDAYKEMGVGDTLEILCGDPDLPSDLCKILPTASCEHVPAESAGDGDSGVCIRLKKRTQHQSGLWSSFAADQKTIKNQGGKNDRSRPERN